MSFGGGGGGGGYWHVRNEPWFVVQCVSMYIIM